MSSVVSKFHDAADSPEAWPDALKALTDAAEVAGAALIILNKSTGNVDEVCFSGLSAEFKSDYLRYYAAVDPYLPLLNAGWKKLSECLPDQLLRKSEWYNDFVLACGVRDILAARIVDTSDHCVIIGIHRQIGRSFSDRADSTLGLVAVPLKDAARRYIERFASLRTGIFNESLPDVPAGGRFYFHVDNKSRYPDETGFVFSTRDEARAHAFVIARELGQDEGWHGSFVLVTDDRGQEITRVRVGPLGCFAELRISLCGEGKFTQVAGAAAMTIRPADAAHGVRTARLPSGEAIPSLGQGTWGMAEDARCRKAEIAALRAGFDLGMTLVDTAEMYADGGAEALVGEAIAGCRDELFLVSKLLPENATKPGTVAACEHSLRRLQTDRLDLYLLHWRGNVPLEETLDAFAALVDAGKIRYWGVSNFDVVDMIELWRLDGGAKVATDQVLYNLTRRGIEYDLMPWCLDRKIPIMAYSPLEQGRLLDHSELKNVAARHNATPAQIALAWLLRQDGVVAIPKAADVAHVRENHAALELHLTKEDLAALDRAFPPPTEAIPLAML